MCKIFDIIFIAHLGDSNNFKGDLSLIFQNYPKYLEFGEIFGPSKGRASGGLWEMKHLLDIGA